MYKKNKLYEKMKSKNYKKMLKCRKNKLNKKMKIEKIPKIKQICQG